jgi:hypothetical protein
MGNLNECKDKWNYNTKRMRDKVLLKKALNYSSKLKKPEQAATYSLTEEEFDITMMSYKLGLFSLIS